MTTVPVDSDGLVDPGRISEEVTDQTILVSCMYANGEIGTIQPVRDIGTMTREQDILFHVDACAYLEQKDIFRAGAGSGPHRSGNVGYRITSTGVIG